MKQQNNSRNVQFILFIALIIWVLVVGFVTFSLSVTQSAKVSKQVATETTDSLLTNFFD